MKTSHDLLLCFSTLFSIYTLIPAAAEQPSPVLDINGNKVRAQVDYYILPVIRGRGGGLTLAPVGNKTCPLNVVQEQLEVENGLPLTFHPINSTKKGVVRVSTDQNIKFSAVSACVQSTVWMVEHEEPTGEYLITTGGVEGNPGREATSNWFKIEKYDDDDEGGRDYKLIFCPTVCYYCKVICKDVGVFVHADGNRVLGLTGNIGNAPSFRVVFKKVTT